MGEAFGIRSSCDHCDGPLVVEPVSTLVDPNAPFRDRFESSEPGQTLRSSIDESFGGTLMQTALLIRREYGPDAVVGLCPWCPVAIVLSVVVDRPPGR